MAVVGSHQRPRTTRWRAAVVLWLVAVASCAPGRAAVAADPNGGRPPGGAAASDRGEALFAGGCFWSMERAFEGRPPSGPPFAAPTPSAPLQRLRGVVVG
jgi:hypothetical protein